MLPPTRAFGPGSWWRIRERQVPPIPVASCGIGYVWVVHHVFDTAQILKKNGTFWNTWCQICQLPASTVLHDSAQARSELCGRLFRPLGERSLCSVWMGEVQHDGDSLEIFEQHLQRRLNIELTSWLNTFDIQFEPQLCQTWRASSALFYTWAWQSHVSAPSHHFETPAISCKCFDSSTIYICICTVLR